MKDKHLANKNIIKGNFAKNTVRNISLNGLLKLNASLF